MKRRTLLIFGLPVVLIVALLVYGLVGREQALAALTRVSNEQAIVPDRKSTRLNSNHRR